MPGHVLPWHLPHHRETVHPTALKRNAENSDLLGLAPRGLVLTALALLWTILLVRVVGLRAFSKMTASDFLATIAAGSLCTESRDGCKN